MASTSTSPKHELEEQHAITEIQLEIALFRAIPEARPVGRHKHIIIIKLQSEIHRRTGYWVDIKDLWGRLEDMYDLEALDEMASSSSSISLPSSPIALSPLIRPNPKHRVSASPLSSVVSPPPPSSPPRKPKSTSTKPKSKSKVRSPSPSSDDSAPPRVKGSAGVINSRHFARTFNIPTLRPATHDDGEEAQQWAQMIYPRAYGSEEEWGAPGEGDFGLTNGNDSDQDHQDGDQSDEEAGKEENEHEKVTRRGIKQEDTDDEHNEEEEEEEDEEEELKGKKKEKEVVQYTRKPVRPPIGRPRARSESSDLSSDEDVDGGQRRRRMGSRRGRGSTGTITSAPGSGKRKRDSGGSGHRGKTTETVQDSDEEQEKEKNRLDRRRKRR